MERRTVAVRLATGDNSGLSVTVTLSHGELEGVLHLHSQNPSTQWSYEVSPEDRETGRAGFIFHVEYAWGWAREASYRGEAENGPLVLPLPGPPSDESFPFPRRRSPIVISDCA